MSDRSDEVTESRDPEDLLEETDRLLSETGVGGDPAESEPRERTEPRRDESTSDDPSGDDPLSDDPLADDSWWGSDESTEPAEPSAETKSASSASLRSRLTGWLSVDNYFSPKAFFALVLLVGAGLFAGATVLPFGGRMIGMFAIAFAIGLLSSKRRYLEMTAAGASVGAVSSLVGHAMLAAAGSFQAVVAVGVVVGLGACLGGYYFGRDLKNGLSQDIE